MVPEIGIYKFVRKIVFQLGMGARRCKKLFFMGREEDDEKERADSSRGKQRQRADSSG